jgi:4-amino-4-deoxy-L-arabinose transferase-like glycosyltransferase
VRSPRSDFARRLLAITGGAALVRALYIFVLTPNQVGSGDWNYYNGVANLIAEGHWFVEPFIAEDRGQLIASASHPPLYSLLLSPLSALGATGFLSHRSLGIILGATTVALLGLLGRRVGGDRVGLVAAAIAALYPILVAADGALLTETLYGPLLAGTLLCAYRLLDEPRPRWAVALGALIGLAALTRSEALLFVPLLALPVALAGGRGWLARATIAAVACALVLTPWTVRNWTAFDQPVAISTQDGPTIAGANCEETYFGGELGGWSFACLSERVNPNEAEQSDIWREEGVRYATAHIERWPEVVTVRLLKLLDFYEPRRQLMFAEGRDRTVQEVGIAVWYLLVPLAAYGAMLLRRRRAPLRILLAPVAVVLLSGVLFYGVTRLRYAAELSVVVLAAVAAVSLVERLAARRSPVEESSAGAAA